jgi:uncharacterized integral membrane protein (TIGR00698 family)
MTDTSSATSLVARFGSGAGHLSRLWPGFSLSALLAMAATFVSTMHGGPQLLYALFFGVALHHLSGEAKSRPGIEFCSRTLLRLGVGLLGARITAAQIAGLGWTTAAVVILGVTSTIGMALVFGRRLGMTKPQSVLSGGAVAICGASAALAISAVLPRDKESDRFTLMVVVTVTVLSTIAMVVYPLIAKLLHLPPQLAGLFLGGTIHDVAQVVGAGYTIDQHTGDVATVVKLFRVAMLTVVVVAVSAAFKRSKTASESTSETSGTGRQPLVPWFLWLFIAMVAANSLGFIAQPVQDSLNFVSRACLVVAISALGMKTSFMQLARAGWQPMMLLVAETLWLAMFVLGCALMMK